MKEFLCSCRCTCGKCMEWRGTWETVCIENELETILITGNGHSFVTILGISEIGGFLCIPAHDIGFSLEEPADTVYVEEHLLRRLEKKDAITIATALREKCKNRK